MVMAAIFVVCAGMRYTHTPQTKAAPKSALDRRTILRPHEIENGILWRRLPLSMRGKRQTCQGETHRDEPADFHDACSSFSLFRGRVRRGIHGWGIARRCRNCRGLMIGHTSRHFSRNPTE